MAPKKKTKRESSRKLTNINAPAKRVTSNKTSDVSDTSEVDLNRMNGYINSTKTPSYPGRLMVDFTRLEIPALKRYLDFYQIVLTDDVPKEQMAAIVARHFDGTLDVDEDDSICSFVRRLRNGGAVSRRSSTKKDRKDKKKKKNSSRKRRMEQHEEDTQEDVELYCICNKPSYGDMIACDGEKCKSPSQWYHLECVGLQPDNHPETWLCPDCESQSEDEFVKDKKK